MKAIVCKRYGPPEMQRMREIPKPTPGDDEVLVKIHASCVNYNILATMRGRPWFARMKTGLVRPKVKVPGGDIAGRVEAVGRNIMQFRLGDEVFGDLDTFGYGALAEYVCAPQEALVLKPGNVSFEEAAATPQAALVALQALRGKGQVAAGKSVLVYGASGGIGTFAVQIAKAFGAEVTGVCSAKNLELVRSIGADHVIDYTSEDFTQSGRLYDVIAATAGYRPIADYERALSPNGIYVATGCTMRGPKAMRQILEAGVQGPRLSKNGNKKLGLLSCKYNRDDLFFIRDLLETGKVKPVIDRCYHLSEANEAFRYYAEGHARGKVVIQM